MKRNRRKLAALLALLLLAGLVAIPIGLTWREVRQERLNHALITAAWNYDTQGVTALLEKGADARAKVERNSKDPLWRQLWDRLRGQSHNTAAVTALQASLEGHVLPYASSCLSSAPDRPSLVRALLDKGADIEVRDIYDETPLMETIGNNAVDSASLLMDHGANVNCVAPKCSPSTPLELAILLEHKSLVKQLLAHGAKVKLKDPDGRTAIDFAGNSYHGTDTAAIIQMLKQAGAKE
jgi:ankyrin repeat protein